VHGRPKAPRNHERQAFRSVSETGVSNARKQNHMATGGVSEPGRYIYTFGSLRCGRSIRMQLLHLSDRRQLRKPETPPRQLEKSFVWVHSNCEKICGLPRSEHKLSGATSRRE
jgi:hypothetical protein